MKKKISAVLALAFLSAASFAYHHGGCAAGNEEIDMGSSIACCVEVGDGSELSCTDGKKWFLVPQVIIEAGSP